MFAVALKTFLIATYKRFMNKNALFLFISFFLFFFSLFFLFSFFFSSSSSSRERELRRGEADRQLKERVLRQTDIQTERQTNRQTDRQTTLRDGEKMRERGLRRMGGETETDS